MSSPSSNVDVVETETGAASELTRSVDAAGFGGECEATTLSSGAADAETAGGTLVDADADDDAFGARAELDAGLEAGLGSATTAVVCCGGPISRHSSSIFF